MPKTSHTIGRPTVAGAILALAAGVWLTALRPDAAAGLAAWVLAPLAAAAAAAVLLPLAARAADALVRAEAGATPALCRATGAAAAGLAVAAAAALGALVTGTAEPARDVLAALAFTVPAAGLLALVRLPVRAAAPAAAPAPAPAKGTTRRNFLQAGAVSSVAVVGIGARVSPAVAAPEPFRLTICEGDRTMVDGTPVFFRGFRPTESSDDRPVIPAPAIGNTGPGVKGREVFEGEQMRVIVTNDTPRDHTFLIERTGSEAPVEPVVGPVTIPANGTREIDFTAPSAGTYIYRDADRNNRVLGMAGVMVVLPQGVGGKLLPYAPSPSRLNITAELRGQWVWALSAVDPVLGELARANRTRSKLDYPATKLLPRYFMINGETGDAATLNTSRTVPVVPLQSGKDAVSGVLIRCVNLGCCTHALHWHGNHVFPVERNGRPEPAGVVFEKDVQRVEPLARISVVLPAHTGYDAFPPLNEHHPKFDEQHFPMHCHAEISQSAAGGSYPFGMLTDWHLTSTEHGARQVRARLTEARVEGARLVPRRKVQAAVATAASRRRTKTATRKTKD